MGSQRVRHDWVTELIPLTSSLEKVSSVKSVFSAKKIGDRWNGTGGLCYSSTIRILGLPHACTLALRGVVVWRWVQLASAFSDQDTELSLVEGPTKGNSLWVVESGLKSRLSLCSWPTFCVCAHGHWQEKCDCRVGRACALLLPPAPCPHEKKHIF